MDIREFAQKYNTESPRGSEALKRWQAERQADDFLNTSVTPGIIIGDLLVGDGVLDRLSPDLREAFATLMGPKADSFEEIRRLIVEKSLAGEASLRGLANKIQGQLGENMFLKSVGKTAQLASSGSQEGWDVVVGGNRYVQVKVYENAHEVIEKMQEVNEKIARGVLGNVKNVEFAVNSDIYSEVREKAKELGLNNRISNLGHSHEELRKLVENDFEDIQDYSGLGNYFGELFKGAVTGLALHGAINAFLVWKGAKEVEQAVEDAVYSSAISMGGLAVTLAAEHVLKLSGGPASWVVLPLAGAGTRAILKRFAERRFVAPRLAQNNDNLRALCSKFRAAI